GHQNILEGIRNLLETMFETVIMVADRRSLFEAIEKVKPDMAIVDLSLPPTDEVGIAQKMKDTFPKLQFVILSVHDESTVIDEVMLAGASGFVLKRSVAVDLFKAIRNVRKGRTFISTSGKH
ncbi:MAG: response regulator transcription factor, partial [Sedimentisphaerales bacterium]|nr:response regulator transcription factor [Sedimentisphaerales bacterium]